MPTINGTAGNDVRNFGTSAGSITLNGMAGNDRLTGGTGGDRLDGGIGADMLIAGPGEDRLAGGLGNDVIYGGAGRDILYGGTGNDAFVIRKGDLDTWSPATGGDTIMDFQGAGGRYGGDGPVDNDFIAFTGFGTIASGARLEYVATSSKLPSLQYYKVWADAAHGGGFSWLAVNLADHANARLVLGAYNFY